MGGTRRDGHTRLGGQRWRCDACRRRCTARSASAFAERCSHDDVIALALRWYARFRLCDADVAAWLAGAPRSTTGRSAFAALAPVAA